MKRINKLRIGTCAFLLAVVLVKYNDNKGFDHMALPISCDLKNDDSIIDENDNIQLKVYSREVMKKIREEGYNLFHYDNKVYVIPKNCKILKSETGIISIHFETNKTLELPAEYTVPEGYKLGKNENGYFGYKISNVKKDEQGKILDIEYDYCQASTIANNNILLETYVEEAIEEKYFPTLDYNRKIYQHNFK